jgi:CheY-like chemotaxis protein
MRILLIDTDGECRAALRIMLEELGHRVVEAGDGKAGLRAFRREGADLVLCDLFMDGLQAVQAFRRESPGVRFVAMSGGGYRGCLEVLDAARLLGADAALAKPLDLDTLRRALQPTAAA